MQYDPIKRSLGSAFNRTPMLRKLFYKLLDLLLLRSWHIKKESRKYFSNRTAEVSILDAGSGFGQYDYFLSNLCENAKITGIDVKEEQIDDCNQFFTKINRPNVKFELGDLTEYILPNTYDFVLSVDVMEHIEEDCKVFENFHASMKDGGMLLISTPSNLGGSDVHDHDEESFIGEHVRDGYSIEDITEKLTKAGFSKVIAKYSYGIWGSISWRFSMKYPIQLLNISKLFLFVIPFWYLTFFPWCCVLNCIDTNTNQKKGTGLIVKAFK